ALRAHLRGAPGAQSDHFRIAAFFLEMTIEHLARELFPDAPGRLRWNCARVNSVEVSSRRKNVRHPARWRPGGTSGHITSVKCPEHVRHFIRHPLEGRHQ